MNSINVQLMDDVTLTLIELIDGFQRPPRPAAGEPIRGDHVIWLPANRFALVITLQPLVVFN